VDPSVEPLLRLLEKLAEQFREFRDGVQKAVQIADFDPEMALTRTRKVLEYLVRDVYVRRCQEPPGTRPLENLLQRLVKDGHFPDRLDAYANTIRKLGNVGTHTFGEKITTADVYQSLNQLLPILEWYFEIERPEALNQTQHATEPVRHRPLTTPLDQGNIAIVPKGLRSFDAKDADFFLDLLPGARDKDGLPDSIRFWKHRIEERNETTFTVGVIYGPSGCGKSSLVKAGLLPRLTGDILSVHIEATADGTVDRLFKALRRRCPDVPSNLDLTGTIAALRQGTGLVKGRKVLLVLDQFEQWLHANRGKENSELAQALRQCDGDHVQCVVLVRDDFWMALTRFMDDLQIELLQGQNSAAVDLFELIHARHVLTSFGRAFGRLSDPLSGDQETFLIQAVEELAQEGKVISVRLSLFAEMMKGKAWTPATLKEVGGTEGVGVTFLEETFSATTAPPEHRYHQKAAHAVLKALLPESGTDIKGHMRSREELLEASGYSPRPRDFDDLLGILDGKIRLLTPTDPEGKSSDESTTKVQVGSKYYQLTHDYLILSLRDWLTRKQKETRRGRMELLLADRAAVWNARPENRQLPSLWQWLSIWALTAKKTWTPPQRKMMQTATRFHVVRGTVVAFLLAATTFTGLALREHTDQRQKETRAAGLVQALLMADTAEVPAIIRDMADLRAWTDSLLRKENDAAPAGSRQKLHTSLALLSDPAQIDYIYGRLLDAQPHEVSVVRDALLPYKNVLTEKLWAVALAPTKGLESQRLRAAAALAKFDPASDQWSAIAPSVIDDHLRENPVYLGLWTAAFKDVRGKFLAPLVVIFHAPHPNRANDRKLAANLLADYAADKSDTLADLTMDADATQFAVLFPKAQDHGERAIAEWRAEIAKQPAAIADKTIFEAKGKIADDDPKVKTSRFALSSKQFEVQLKGGTTYHIAMTGSKFSSFLVVHDKTGKEVAFDFDGGGDPDPQLITPSQDDTYTVFAAAWNAEGMKVTGACVFSLQIAETAESAKENLAKRQANAAAALLRMNRPEGIWPLLKHSSDPRTRSYLIHRMGPMGVDAGMIVKRLAEEPDLSIRRALILGFGEYGESAISPEDRKTLLAKLHAICRSNSDSESGADPGLRAAAEWLLRAWKQEGWLKQKNEEWRTAASSDAKRIERVQLALDKGTKAPQWYINGQGQTMVVIPGPVEVQTGSPQREAGHNASESPQQVKRIDWTFAVAAKAVTTEQYRRFDPNYSEFEKYSPEADCPVLGQSWYQAALYCNWLSKAEGIEPEEWCYELVAPPPPKTTKAEEIDPAELCNVVQEKYEGKVRIRNNYLRLSGYRLPTEAEMEFVTRAGSVTSRCFGETEELLPKYAWYAKNSGDRSWPVGCLKPNDLGFFDIHGNCCTWCQEAYEGFRFGGKENSDVDGKQGRTVRGGSHIDRARDVRSATRHYVLPASQGSSLGLRPARTLPPIP
jgi:formylglycine-generating enzyme required for sulfatase activity